MQDNLSGGVGPRIPGIQDHLALGVAPDDAGELFAAVDSLQLDREAGKGREPEAPSLLEGTYRAARGGSGAPNSRTYCPSSSIPVNTEVLQKAAGRLFGARPRVPTLVGS